ncbi:MAG: N-formylglutamate amidohydrolase [Burkholderiaceae bacterium]
MSGNFVPNCPDWLPTRIVLTCEHASRVVPARWRRLFREHRLALRSHRGSDIGALSVAQGMEDYLGVTSTSPTSPTSLTPATSATWPPALLAAPLLSTSATRLLIDLNRSLDNPEVFSEMSRSLNETERVRIIDKYYLPHRNRVQALVAETIAEGHQVLHVGVHSFVDVFHGEQRNVDVGLLFDPDRISEASFCDRWLSSLSQLPGGLRYRANQPYLGTDDGLTTALRMQFDPLCYAGVEIELRQGLLGRARPRRRLASALTQSLRSLFAQNGQPA